MDQCNTDWQACCGPSGSDAPADYNTMVGSCSTARDSMNGVQTALSGGAATAFFGAVAAFNATGQYLAGLPSNSVRTAVPLKEFSDKSYGDRVASKASRCGSF